MISFRCEACAKSFSVADNLAGKKAKCKACGHVTRIPFASEVGFAGKSNQEVDPYRLEDPAPKGRKTFDPYDDVDDEPLPNPQRGLPVAAAAAPSSKSKPSKQGSSGESGSSFLGAKGGIGILLTVGFVALRIYLRMNRHQGQAQQGNNPPPPAFNEAGVPGGNNHDPNAASPPITMPAFPERTPGREVEPGVSFQIIKMGPLKPGLLVRPAHGMTLWLYLPNGQGKAAEKSLPCVMIAPAGSILITGNELTSDAVGDHPEHLPWVRAGFAVLAYGLDGEFQKDLGDESREIGRASRTFLAARAGLTNAEVALKWMLAKVPEVDPNRIYTVGHSSAGTMALLLAENEPRIKAVAAFAPAADVAARFTDAQKTQFRWFFSEIPQFFTTYNPAEHVDRLNSPVFLFGARDDTNVTFDQVEAFAAKLKSHGKNVTLEEVPQGGHYTAMIEEGIPRALKWIQGIDQARK